MDEPHWSHNPPLYELIKFKPIKESQLLRDAGPVMNFGKASPFTDSQELLYKCLKTEVRLVRSIMEAHGFRHTDGHDWNLLWTGSGSKSYLFEGLTEYQRINHFPQSTELTRKDRMCYHIVKM